jgi:hypothetical protein
LIQSSHLITEDRDADVTLFVDTGVIDLRRKRDLWTQTEAPSGRKKRWQYRRCPGTDRVSNMVY